MIRCTHHAYIIDQNKKQHILVYHMCCFHIFSNIAWLRFSGLPIMTYHHIDSTITKQSQPIPQPSQVQRHSHFYDCRAT